MAGAVGTDLLVGGMLERSPFVADGGVQNSRHLAETGFHAPETSCAKRCFFSCHVLLLVTLLRFALRSVARVLGGRVCFCWCRDCFPLCWMPEGLLCHPASEKTSVKNASILRLSTDTRQSPESRRFTVTFRGLGLVSKEVVPRLGTAMVEGNRANWSDAWVWLWRRRCGGGGQAWPWR